MWHRRRVRYAFILALWFQTGQYLSVLGYNRSLYNTGSSVHIRTTFHDLDRLTFIDFESIMLSNVQSTAIGVQDSIVYRDMDSSQNNGPLGYEAVLLFDFSERDSTPASLLISAISEDSEVIFPSDQFGANAITFVGLLECSHACGEHGMRIPLYSEKEETISCGCECDPGWDTDLNQDFESFKYCSLHGESIQGPPVQNSIDGSWRPPVTTYPPPPPKTYENESSSKKLPLFKWAIIGTSIIISAVVIFILCKTRCCGICKASCCCCCSDTNDLRAMRIPKQYIVHTPPPYHPNIYEYDHQYPMRQMGHHHSVSPLAHGKIQNTAQ